jgi:uncharacterized RDD family membrane protein YckC
MEENINNTQTVPAQNSTPTPAAPVTQTSSGSVEYASFFTRFAAALLDGLIVGIPLNIVLGILGINESGRSGIVMLATWAYSVYFISNKGATIGKNIMKIKVQSLETGGNPDMVSAILREVVGKLLSGAILLLGYFWMLWDDKKQTWHDKVGKTIVVKA